MITEVRPASLDMYAVFATDGEGKVWRVSDPMETYDEAVSAWGKLDADHRKGLLPQVRHFEVRSVGLGEDRPVVGPTVFSHGKYDQAPISLNLTRRVTNSRGFKSVESASRAAWQLFAPSYRPRKEWHSGVQGLGGWFYWPNGVPAAQGLHGLAQLCQQRRMVVQGANGRWYVVDQDVL